MPFKLFNSLGFQNVDLTAWDIPRLTTSPAIGYVKGKPDLETARYWARVAAGLVMSPSHQPLRDPKGHLRIEHGPQYLVLDQEEGVTTDKPADLIAVLDAIHDEWNKYPDHPEFKNLKVGLFGSLAAAEPSDLDDPSAVDDWNARTDALAPVAKAVDFVVPVLYANTTNVSDFAASMSTLIRQARRFGKPVYAYIWPEYFEQIQEMPPNELIGRQMWQMILDETRSEADAGIMWGGIHRFDARAPWARITAGYLKQPALPAPAAPGGFVVDPVGLHLHWQAVESTSRVRIERSLDNGGHWRAIGITEPGADHFDDPGYRAGFSPIYRIQAFNPFAASPYVTNSVIKPARDAFAVHHAYWCDARHPGTTTMGPMIFNIWHGRWVEFSNVSFAHDADHFEALFRNEEKSTMEIWIDCDIHPDGSMTGGTKVGSMFGRRTFGDSPVMWLDQSCPVNIPGGPGVKHNVFITCADVGGISLDWIKFGRANDPPAAPRRFSAASHGGSVELTWLDTSDDETGFRVERSIDQGWTWSSFVDTPANPLSANPLVTYTDHPPSDATYTYRISALHGTGAAPYIIPDTASAGPSTRPAGAPFKADDYDRAVGLNEQVPGVLFHTEYGISSHPGEPVKGAWIKYSGVDFGGGSDRITLDDAPAIYIDPAKVITFYIDRIDPDHKIGSITPMWKGSFGIFDDDTAEITRVSGVHDLYMQLDDPTVAADIKTIRIDRVSPVPQILSNTGKSDRAR